MKQTFNILRGWPCSLLCLVLFAACSSDDDGQVPQQPSQEQTYPLIIEVTENPMITDGEEGGRSTRTDITETSTLSAFNMNYVYGASYATGSITAEKDNEDGKWKSEGTWPTNAGADGMVYWYASTNGTFQPNSGSPYINFKVNTDVANQHDLLVATTSDTYNNYTTKGKLNLTFDHACAALRLFIKKAKNLDGYTLRVSKVVLKHVPCHGMYDYNTEAWALITTQSTDIADYTLYPGPTEQELGSEDYTAMDGGTPTYLFMIPQTLTAWDPGDDLSDTYLELTCTINGGASQTAYIPFGATLEKGTQYNVKINIGKNSLYSGPNTKIIP